MKTALVMTVLNESASLPDFLPTLDAQALSPDVVVVVDGGSTDGTVEQLRAWASVHPQGRVVHEAPGANISQGRNIGFGLVDADVVAVTDAGTRLDPHWFERLVRTWQDTGADVVSGFFSPSGTTFFERVLAAIITPRLREVRPDRFLPSSRSVLMTRGAWARVGGYPPWLDYCEDLLLDMRLRELGATFVFCEEALVTWSARSSIRGFFVQYYRYARGDGKAGIKSAQHGVRYLVYVTGAGLVAASTVRPWAVAVLGLGAVAYLAPQAARLVQGGTVRGAELARGLALVPVVAVVGDIARMCGFPAGRRWRRRAQAAGLLPPWPQGASVV